MGYQVIEDIFIFYTNTLPRVEFRENLILDSGAGEMKKLGSAATVVLANSILRSPCHESAKNQCTTLTDQLM